METAEAINENITKILGDIIDTDVGLDFLIATSGVPRNKHNIDSFIDLLSNIEEDLLKPYYETQSAALGDSKLYSRLRTTHNMLKNKWLSKQSLLHAHTSTAEMNAANATSGLNKVDKKSFPLGKITVWGLVALFVYCLAKAALS